MRIRHELVALALAAACPALCEDAPASAKVWIGRYADYEEFLKTAAIEHLEDVGMGVTKPRRAFFASGSLAASAITKHLPPGRQQGYWESYKSEIAAYELDKLLAMEMVPVTVERRVDGDLVSVQLWVENCKLLKSLQNQTAPDVEAWNRQVYRQRVFDALVANIDRNSGNLLVDTGWHLILIDHSRCFTDTSELPFEKQMTRIDRPFFEHLLALDSSTLKQHLGPWVLGDAALHALLKRRDQIVTDFRRLAAAKGEAAVFIP